MTLALLFYSFEFNLRYKISTELTLCLNFMPCLNSKPLKLFNAKLIGQLI